MIRTRSGGPRIIVAERNIRSVVSCTCFGITVAPGGERILAGMILFNAFCSILFGGLAVFSRRHEPAQSVLLLRLLQGVAVVATVLVSLVVGYIVAQYFTAAVVGIPAESP